MKERAVMEGHPDKKFDIVSISPHSLGFGQGRAACPGRFLAAADLKMMLTYVVVTYDLKLADGVRPPDVFVMAYQILQQKFFSGNLGYKPISDYLEGSLHLQ